MTQDRCGATLAGRNRDMVGANLRDAEEAFPLAQVAQGVCAPGRDQEDLRPVLADFGDKEEVRHVTSPLSGRSRL